MVKNYVRLLVLGVFALLLVGCPPPQPKPPVEPDQPYEPDPPVDGDPAEAACAKFEELKCVSRDGRNLWEDTPGGVSCPDVFRNAEKNGVDLHPACIAHITKCEQRHDCTAKP